MGTVLFCSSSSGCRHIELSDRKRPGRQRGICLWVSTWPSVVTVIACYWLVLLFIFFIFFFGKTAAVFCSPWWITCSRQEGFMMEKATKRRQRKKEIEEVVGKSYCPSLLTVISKPPSGTRTSSLCLLTTRAHVPFFPYPSNASSSLSFVAFKLYSTSSSCCLISFDAGLR